MIEKYSASRLRPATLIRGKRRFAASSLLRLLRHHLSETTFCAEPCARPVVVAIPNRILDWLGPALEAVAQDKAHRAA